MVNRRHRRPWRTGLALLLAAGFLLWAAGCSSQQQEQEAALSALHYFQRGNAAFQAEDFDHAVTHYRMALQFDPEAPDIHYNLGLTYYRAGAYKEAAAAYEEALRLDPKFAEAHLNLALALNKLYNAGGANLHYNRYRALVMGQSDRNATADARPPQPGSTPPDAGMASAMPSGGQAPPSAAVQAARQLRGAPASSPSTTNAPPAEAAPNPFQGNSKWWTQDTANLNR